LNEVIGGQIGLVRLPIRQGLPQVLVEVRSGWEQGCNGVPGKADDEILPGINCLCERLENAPNNPGKDLSLPFGLDFISPFTIKTC
jgi:hypothetical protein